MTFRTLRTSLLATTVAALLLSLPSHADAQSGRYSTWTPPGSTGGSGQAADGSTQNLLKDLKTLVDEAEKARAADRLFLKDLRDLMARYERPWSDRVLFDDFMDGDFTKAPTWSVITGEFWVEQGYGLRSKATLGVSGAGSGAAASGGGSDRQLSKEELAISILGAVLQGANKNKSSNTQQAQPAPKAEPAVLSARARIPNAFAIKARFSSWTGAGDFAFAVTQGPITQKGGGAGYRVVYTPKQTARGASLELVRVTSRGEGRIDRVTIDGLEDQKVHSLDWTRGRDGQMVVTLDGKQVMSARDTSFRDPFDAVALINAGADVIVKSVEVLGVK